MSNVRVSVVIAAYNAEKYIASCIESIIAQTVQDWEMLICDDCSTDETVSIIRSYQEKDKRIKLIQNTENIRAGASRNKCIEQSIGKYIMIQDADDLCEPNRMECLIHTLETSQVDFVSSGHYLFDENGRYKTNIPKKECPQKNDFLFGMPFCHAATMFQRNCLEAVSGYRISKETRRGQDYDLFMRLYAHGFLGCNIQNVLYGYRVDKGTIARRKLSYRIDECKIRYKGFKALGLLPAGLPYVVKPIAAYFVQRLKGNKG